jgi:hypothetical protein
VVPQWFTTAALPLFSFSQVELPWSLGPPDGRYLIRPAGAGADAPASHVLLVSTLGAPRRPRPGRRRRRPAPPGPAPAPVSTGRATVIAVEPPLADAASAMAWLSNAGEDRLAADLAVLNRALHEFRLAVADPYVQLVERGRVLVARVGFGEGEQVASGDWTQARELVHAPRRERRARLLEPQARLAAMLGGREPPLVSAELALRARLDVDHDRFREAALQLRVALDAALAELGSDGALAGRVAELQGERDAVEAAARAALAGPLSAHERETVTATLGRLEAALRARAFARA